MLNALNEVYVKQRIKSKRVSITSHNTINDFQHIKTITVNNI